MREKRGGEKGTANAKNRPLFLFLYRKELWRENGEELSLGKGGGDKGRLGWLLDGGT